MAFNTTRWTLANLLPVLFVVKIIASLWLLYVFLHLLPLLQSTDAAMHQRGVWQAVVSQSITFVMLICFVRAIVADPGSVPNIPEWQQGARPVQEPGQSMTAELKQTGERRFCKWCNQYKPDRCHHCRVCRSCILRMDHHCPWIANCVGFGNHKFFLLLVLYAMIDCMFIMVTITETMGKAVTEEMTPLRRFGIVYCMTLAGLMTLLLVPFFCLHMSFMSKAQTTIEFCEKRTKTHVPISYDIGLMQNARNTLGPNILLWLVPISPPEGDGLYFRTLGSAAGGAAQPLIEDKAAPAAAGAPVAAPMTAAAPAAAADAGEQAAQGAPAVAPEVTGARASQM